MTGIVVGTVAMTSGRDVVANLAQAKSFVRSAKEAGATWVLLPEVFHYFGDYDLNFVNADPKIREQVASWAQEFGVYLFAGTIGERAPSEARRVYNTLNVFDPTGRKIADYRKIHLFNLRDSKGEKSHCEEDGFVPGEKCTTLEIDGFHVGLAICYDLRFPEFFVQLSATNPCRPLDVIILPAAFTRETGAAHWEVLLRSRAIEWQCYIIAANQTGQHENGKQSFGHSMIIDPWGEVLASTGESQGLVTHLLDLKRIHDVRNRLPALANKCLPQSINKIPAGNP
jgi:deaminated glutathione amidase